MCHISASSARRPTDLLVNTCAEHDRASLDHADEAIASFRAMGMILSLDQSEELPRSCYWERP